MAFFTGPEFVNFSVPLVYDKRYFIVEPGDRTQVSVVFMEGDVGSFEILRNRPGIWRDSSLRRFSDSSIRGTVNVADTGELVVSEMGTGKLAYKVMVDNAVRVTCFGGDCCDWPIHISARHIRGRWSTFDYGPINQRESGAYVGWQGNLIPGAQLPWSVLRALETDQQRELRDGWRRDTEMAFAGNR